MFQKMNKRGVDIKKIEVYSLVFTFIKSLKRIFNNDCWFNRILYYSTYERKIDQRTFFPRKKFSLCLFSKTYQINPIQKFHLPLMLFLNILQIFLIINSKPCQLQRIIVRKELNNDEL